MWLSKVFVSPRKFGDYRASLTLVITGLVPVIPTIEGMVPRYRDGRNKSGHDHAERQCTARAYFISSFASAMYIGSETGSLAALAAIGCEA